MRNFGISTGSIILADYQLSNAQVYNSYFQYNAALQGGVFAI